jgi:pyruvate/2-oxoglutarate dehydrogenase complex dihydrolipoamide dehydrogenase (E3) component
VSNDSARGSYDLLVIGAGPAGGGAAHAAAATGRRVALVERDKVGGTCLNYGCDPTKALLHTARLLHQARHAEPYGLRIRAAEADWPAVQSGVRAMVEQMRGGSEAQVREEMAEKGIDLLHGEARFVGAHEVSVGGQVIYADQIIIAAGSAPAVPDVPGLRDAGFITNKEAVYLSRLPRRLAIVGGGPIGIEFAQMFHRFDVEVTVLEAGKTLLAKDDRELADRLCELLAAEGIRMETGVELRRVAAEGGQKQLTFRCADRSEERLLVDEVLVAAGFHPALDTLDLDAAGVETGDDGIVVDEALRTSVPHIWAAGDVLGGYQFTHVAFDQGRLAASNAFADRPEPFDDRAIPWVTFTDPELAHVGKTEEQLREDGVRYTVGRKPMDGVERAVAIRQTEGQVKLLVGDDGKILGGHILAASAGELIAPVVLAMRAGIDARALAQAILPYPTLAEGVRWAAEEAQAE